jgi:hypothetical protein
MSRVDHLGKRHMVAINDDSEANLQAAIAKLMLPEQGPLGQLAFALAAASIDCGQTFQNEIGTKQDRDHVGEILLICLEFVYFFLHTTKVVMKHTLLARKNNTRIVKLQTLVIRLVVEMFLHSLEEGRKAQLLSDVFDHLRAADISYQQATPSNSIWPFALIPLQEVLADRLAGMIGSLLTGPASLKRISSKVDAKWAQLAVVDWMPDLAHGA